MPIRSGDTASARFGEALDRSTRQPRGSDFVTEIRTTGPGSSVRWELDVSARSIERPYSHTTWPIPAWSPALCTTAQVRRHSGFPPPAPAVGEAPDSRTHAYRDRFERCDAPVRAWPAGRASRSRRVAGATGSTHTGPARMQQVTHGAAGPADSCAQRPPWQPPTQCDESPARSDGRPARVGSTDRPESSRHTARARSPPLQMAPLQTNDAIAAHREFVRTARDRGLQASSTAPA